MTPKRAAWLTALATTLAAPVAGCGGNDRRDLVAIRVGLEAGRRAAHSALAPPP
jgi:hypothetical protein